MTLTNVLQVGAAAIAVFVLVPIGGFIWGWAINRMVERMEAKPAKPAGEPDDVFASRFLCGLALFVLAALLGGMTIATCSENLQRQHCERLDLAYIDGECRNLPTERPSN